MSEAGMDIFRAALIGIGGTLILDLWALLLDRAMQIPAPYFVMMPGMGSGIAGSKTPQPNVTRLKSFASHSVFGLGMYVTAVGLARTLPL